jgi:hypothetical protein
MDRLVGDPVQFARIAEPQHDLGHGAPVALLLVLFGTRLGAASL